MPDPRFGNLWYTERRDAEDLLLPVHGRQMRILIADNDRRVRSALYMLLKQEPGLTVQESSDLGGLAAQVRSFKPDLVLLDWELPGRPAAALLLALDALSSRPKVMVLSRRSESETEALAAGADAFASKTDPPEELLAALRSLVNREALAGEEVPAVAAN